MSPNTMAVFELATFNGALYAGVGDGVNGYSVWRTKAGSPARFEPVVTEGAGRGKAITSVVSMQVFNDRLYVGASGWPVVFPSSELIRINRDDSFDVVVGEPEGDDGCGPEVPRQRPPRRLRQPLQRSLLAPGVDGRRALPRHQRLELGVPVVADPRLAARRRVRLRPLRHL